MKIISSTSGRTLTIEEGLCGLSVSVRDGRKDGRSILLNRDAVRELSNAILEWLNEYEAMETNTRAQFEMRRQRRI
jgi:hypothetical protein